ncbi:hypothetical protein [Streptomyces formicae]|uniref:Uncharacterized protein n=1 Tax=Streptomyces formicae TaxID=1616117 RepID=A0ABY3WIA9_9ACTN|nr:hypothetical protein [Streptomyces formicae]UNM12334.1 hypothetical protein J4032_13015 [Streptomyces formicae]
MEWFTQLGNMSALFPDTPALAFDMALNGAEPNLVGYDLAYALQAAPTPINVYPTEEPSFAEPVM